MKRFLIILLALYANFSVFGQQDKLLELITSSLWIYESNPIHIDESQRINMAFVDIINANKSGNPESSKTSRNDVFKLLYENGFPDVGNEFDSNKSRLRKSVCFASIALLSDKDRFKYFMGLAKQCVTDSVGKPIKGMEKEYGGLVLIDLFVKYKFKVGTNDDLKVFDDYLEKFKDIMSKDFYYSGKLIIEKLKK